MTTECSTIIVILLLIAGVMARRGKTGAALAVLPLGITPVSYLFSGYLARAIDRLQPADAFAVVQAAVVVTGALVACLILGFFASKVRSGATRKSYLFLCGGFTLALTVVILSHVLS